MQLNHNIDLTNQSQGNSEKIGTKIVWLPENTKKKFPS